MMRTASVLRHIVRPSGRCVPRRRLCLPFDRFAPISNGRSHGTPFEAPGLTRPLTTVIDSRVFRNIFSTDDSARIWSDERRTSYYLEFEAALARVQARLGIIPQNAADEIVKHCQLGKIDFDELRKQTELIGYPVLPVVKQLVKQVNEVEDGLGEWAHWGATTQVHSCSSLFERLQAQLAIGSYGHGNGTPVARYSSRGGERPRSHYG